MTVVHIQNSDLLEYGMEQFVIFYQFVLNFCSSSYSHYTVAQNWYIMFVFIYNK